MKRFVKCLLIGLLLGSFASQASAATSTFVIGNGNYSINGTVKKDLAPFLKNGRTFLPIRYVAYALGIGDNSIYWDDASQTAYIARGKSMVVLKKGANSMTVDGRTVPLEQPVQEFGGRIVLPLRAIAEAFGCKVDWNETRQMVSITSTD